MSPIRGQAIECSEMSKILAVLRSHHKQNKTQSLKYFVGKQLFKIKVVR